jgi:hypothetical protein
VFLGSATDILLTEPEAFAKEFVVSPQRAEELLDNFVPAPEGYKGTRKADKAWRAEQEAEGKVVITPGAFKAWGLDMRTETGRAWRRMCEELGLAVLSRSDLEQVNGAVAAVRAYDLAMDLINGAELQTVAVWQDEGTGVWCKARLDIYRRKDEPFPIVGDLKTTAKPVTMDMGSHAFNAGWHRQLAFYCDGCEAITGQEHDHARIIAVEQQQVHRVEVFELAPSVLEQGREEYRAALMAYENCQRRDHWPTNSGTLQILWFPGWATK